MRTALPSILRLIANLLFIGVLAAPAAVALAAIGGFGHRWPDILVQFTGPALIATIALTLGLVLLRLNIAASVGVIVILLLLIGVWPQWAPPKGQPKPGAPVVRIYMANLWARNEDVAAIAASISEARPDIVVLVELGDAPAAEIDGILSDLPHRVSTARVGGKGGPTRSMIASRYPLEQVVRGLDTLNTVGARADTPFGPLNVLGVHMTRPWPYQYQWGQINQATRLAEVRRNLNGPVVVAGDFNSVTNGRIGRQIKTETGLISEPGFPGTWPSNLPAVLGMSIDHVWRSSDLALIDRRLGQKNGSDHRPVIVEITPAVAG